MWWVGGWAGGGRRRVSGGAIHDQLVTAANQRRLCPAGAGARARVLARVLVSVLVSVLVLVLVLVRVPGERWALGRPQVKP